ncbi:MAG: DoxX family membrane protein [Methylococcaceae bacterium]|nr:DoxX family membrane protein [Methylococcaceae bacterium]
MNLLQVLSAPLGRTLLALIFFISGVNKAFSYEGTQGYMEAFNVSGSLLPLVIVIEVLAGLAVIVGYKARLAAFILAGFSLVSAFIFHANFTDQMQMILFMKNLGLAGGLLLLVSNGAGAYALDNRLESETM